MSGGLDVLQMKEEDVLKFLAAGTHLGGTNLDFQMEQYIYKRKSDGKQAGWVAWVGQLRSCGHNWEKQESASASSFKFKVMVSPWLLHTKQC